MTIFTKKILISNEFYNKIKDTEYDGRKVSILAGLIITILHEIAYCLTNYLPSYSSDFSRLCNPFIGTFKKNVEIYDFIVGKSPFNGNDLFDFLKEKIENYKLIKDSRTLFEKKIFGTNYQNNYLNSEYFLRIENLQKSLKNFKAQYSKFIEEVNNEGLDILNTKTFIVFKRVKDSFYFWKCIFDPEKYTL